MSLSTCSVPVRALALRGLTDQRQSAVPTSNAITCAECVIGRVSCGSTKKALDTLTWIVEIA